MPMFGGGKQRLSDAGGGSDIVGGAARLPMQRREGKKKLHWEGRESEKRSFRNWKKPKAIGGKKEKKKKKKKKKKK